MKTYTFKEEFTVKTRKEPRDIFYAMGETHIAECVVFDLYLNGDFIETYDTFEEARDAGYSLFG